MWTHLSSFEDEGAALHQASGVLPPPPGSRVRARSATRPDLANCWRAFAPVAHRCCGLVLLVLGILTLLTRSTWLYPLSAAEVATRENAINTIQHEPASGRCNADRAAFAASLTSPTFSIESVVSFYTVTRLTTLQNEAPYFRLRVPLVGVWRALGEAQRKGLSSVTQPISTKKLVARLRCQSCAAQPQPAPIRGIELSAPRRRYGSRYHDRRYSHPT